MHVSHAKEKSGSRTDALHRPFKLLGLMYPTTDGRNICTTAQRFCLARHESPVAAENLMRFDMIIAVQVPQPCPLRNTCSVLGSHRRHSGSRSFLQQCIHSRVQVKDDWDALKVYTIGGKNPLFYPYFLPSSDSLPF